MVLVVVVVGGVSAQKKKKAKGAPFLEEALPARGGQPKGRILALESGRGEEG